MPAQELIAERRDDPGRSRRRARKLTVAPNADSDPMSGSPNPQPYGERDGMLRGNCFGIRSAASAIY